MNETERAREAYARRAARGADDRYDLSDRANVYLFERREANILDLLCKHGLLALKEQRIVDIGCGNGSVLRDFVRWGATPSLCAGIDLLEERIEAGNDLVAAGCDLRAGSAGELPWPDESFDLAIQFTLLSSVLDPQTRRRIAAETMRVLRPGGALVYYDFIWNPGNADTRGLGLKGLQTLYPNRSIDARRVTLAPPIGRRLARVSFAAARLAEAVPLLRSHYLALVRK
jgi:ubiquinone/menaquinone biosynthesis C-methylase UbiE